VKTLFFIVNKSLQGNVCGQEFLDMALMAAAFDQKVVLLFEGEGVNALVKNQCPDSMELKNIVPVLNALPIYDINDVLVEEESMDVWGLVEEEFEISVNALSRKAIKEQLNLADHVFSF